MATLVKPWIVSWRDAGGNRVPPHTKGAKQTKRRSKKWYAQNVPGFPARKRIPLATNRTVAERMLQQLIDQGERGAAGMTDLAQARRPLTEHLDDYKQYLLNEGDTEKHAAHTRMMCEAIIAGCKFGVMGDLDAPAVANWLGEQRRRKVKPHSVSTSNHYLTAIKAFSAWLAGPSRRTTIDPLKHLSKGDPETDRRRVRRALTFDDVNAIVAAARVSSVEYRGLSGSARATLYLTAAMTGFRRSELASLTPAWFALDADPPTVKLPAALAKNRKKTTQPIPPALADAIREYTAAAKIPTGAELWPGSWSDRAAEMLRVDLAAANIPYIRDDEVADLHALRHSFITWLVEVAGATVSQAMILSRHTDPNLTIARYTHTQQRELGGVVGRIGNAKTLPEADELTRLRARVSELESEVERLKKELAMQPGVQTGGA